MKWGRVEDTKKLAEIEKIGGNFRYDLPIKLINPDEIAVQLRFPSSYKGKLMKEIDIYIDFKNFIVEEEAGKALVLIDFEALGKRLKANSVKRSWDVTITITYPEI